MKPPTRYAATSMCAASSGIALLKITATGSTSTTLPEESRVKPDGAFIQALAATTEMAPRMPASTIGTPVQKCAHGRSRLPAVDVDRDEDRLGEEEDPLEAERDPEGLAPLAHELRPEQPELEAQHRAGHGADRERDRHVLRPPLREQQGVGVAVLDPAVVGDQRHERPRDAERHQDDVEGQGEGHLRAGPGHRVDGEDVERGGHGPEPACSAPGTPSPGREDLGVGRRSVGIAGRPAIPSLSSRCNP